MAGRACLALVLLLGSSSADHHAGVDDDPNQLDQLWLRQAPVADAAQLKRYRSQFKAVHVVGDEKSLADETELAQLHTVADELGGGLTSLLGVNVSALCCAAPPPPGCSRESGTLYVEVNAGSSSLAGLGTEGFQLGRTGDGNVHLRALRASAALYGSFRLLSFLQRAMPVPGDSSPYRSIPRMELRIWDFWDDLSGDVTRGFAGDSLVWPHALWRNPDIEDGPPPTKLFVAQCDPTDPKQHWAGKALSSPGTVSGFMNGNGMCVTADKSPPSVAACTTTPTDKKTLFYYNASALQLSIGPLVPGVDGAGRECLDINHALGPNIDTYHCHPLYPGGGGERDYKNQQFRIRPVPPHAAAAGAAAAAHTHEQPAWQQLESVSAAGQCLTLRNSFPPSPAAPIGVSFSQRFVQLMRLLKSAGVNGLVLNDVNACYGDNGDLLHSDTLTNVSRNLRPTMARYGITPYICACFGAPLVMENVTADPLALAAQEWWRRKASELWKKWPNFGGFLVKADSEGNVGPLMYNRTEADGANLLARAVAPHDGIVMWRAFVYGNRDFGDLELVRQSYATFAPLDGQFDDNVILQIKNGPMDFQIREPLHPLLGAMKRTNVMMAVQAAQEYTGQQIHAVNLVTMWSEYLTFDTHVDGPGSTILKLLSNSSVPGVAPGRKRAGQISGMACVSNFGSWANWTGHVLAAANSFGFGRLAWDGLQPASDAADGSSSTTTDSSSVSTAAAGAAGAADVVASSAEAINREWAELTFPSLQQHEAAVATVVSILQRSRAIYEGYTSPLGIGFIVFGGGGYKAGHGACAPVTPGPGSGPNGEMCPSSPGRRRLRQNDRNVGQLHGEGRTQRRRLDLRGGLDHYWVDPCSNYGTSNYSDWGLGCDRTTINQRSSPTDAGGTGYAGDYAPANRDLFNDPQTCPQELLLWFHHLPWTHPMAKPANYTPVNCSGSSDSSECGGGNSTITLYEFIRFTHYDAVQQAEGLARQWDSLQGLIDVARFKGVQARFAQQVRDAAVMCDAIMVQYERWYKRGLRANSSRV